MTPRVSPRSRGPKVGALFGGWEAEILGHKFTQKQQRKNGAFNCATPVCPFRHLAVTREKSLAVGGTRRTLGGRGVLFVWIYNKPSPAAQDKGGKYLPISQFSNS